MPQRIARQFAKRERAANPCSISAEARVLFSDDAARTSTVDRVPDPNGAALEAAWDEEWQKHLLQAATEHLKQRVSAEHFQMFDLYVLQQWPAREVARVLGVNVGQVYLNKLRVGAMLKKELKRLQIAGR